MPKTFFLALVLLVGFMPIQAQTTVSRYELGRRTRQTERAWMRCTDPDRRKQAIPVMQKAVGAFFSGKTNDVAATLDEAAGILAGTPRADAARWADALGIDVSPRLIDSEATTVTVRADAAYAVAATRPDLSVTLCLENVKKPLMSIGLKELPVEKPVALPKGKEGDTALVLAVTDGSGAPVREWRITVSRVRDPKRRLETLGKAVAAMPNASSIEAATAKLWFDRLSQLAGGTTAETDYPAAKILTDVERTITGKGLAGRTGELFLAIPTGSGATPLRAFVPSPDAKVLVIALHGAGGSENMFFDTYGDGEIVRLCRARGWALVAPRVSSPLDNFEAIADAAQKLLVPKAEKRLVVGHSLGAISSVLMVVKSPSKFAGMACISGTARNTDLSPLGRMPVFVSVGTQDFSRGGSTDLAKQLEKNGTPVTFKLYEAEHLLVVADALPDVFTWMDRVVGK